MLWLVTFMISACSKGIPTPGICNSLLRLLPHLDWFLNLIHSLYALLLSLIPPKPASYFRNETSVSVLITSVIQMCQHVLAPKFSPDWWTVEHFAVWDVMQVNVLLGACLTHSTMIRAQWAHPIYIHNICCRCLPGTCLTHSTMNSNTW